MPTYNSHTVFDLARGIKAFVSLKAGVTRGEVQETGAAASQSQASLEKQVAEREQRIERLKEQLKRRDRRIAQLEKSSGKERFGG